jgi:hypothetical protein
MIMLTLVLNAHSSLVKIPFAEMHTFVISPMESHAPCYWRSVPRIKIQAKAETATIYDRAPTSLFSSP